MKMLWLILALFLAGCGGQTGPALVEPVICPASATAALEPEPARPVLTEEQQLALDIATITALGPDLGQALIRFTDAEHPAYARRLAARIEETRVWCEGQS